MKFILRNTRVGLSVYKSCILGEVFHFSSLSQVSPQQQGIYFIQHMTLTSYIIAIELFHISVFRNNKCVR